MTRAESGSLVDNFAIFDIRSVNTKVTEVFYGVDWSSAKWIRVEEIEPRELFESLLGDFERKMMQKQKLVARVSPARTPSHLIASMTLASTAKKRRPVSGSDSDSSSLNSSPIRHETPLKKSKTLMKEAIALHSDYSGSEEDEVSLVYPEPAEEEAVIVEKKLSQSRCIIM